MVAVFSAGVLAGVIAVLPLIIPDQEPSRQTVAAASTDGRAPAAETLPDEEPAADPCAGQTWPYIDGACADAKAKERDTRQVRVISTDRAAPTTLATRTPRIEPKKPAPAQPAAAAAPAEPAPVTPTVQTATAPQPQPAPPPAATTEVASEAPPAPATEPAKAEVKRVTLDSEPAAEAKSDPKPDNADTHPAAKVHTAAAPAEPSPAAQPSPRKSKTVTVSSKRAKRSKPQPAHDHAAPSSEPGRELARGRTQPVPDPGRSLDGPTIVRTYQYADGRRVTVYQRADRSGAGAGQAMADGGGERFTRRVVVPMED